MSYTDLLRTFSGIDVNKTHKGWYVGTVADCSIRRDREEWVANEACVELRATDPTWLTISVCQPSKRGKANEDFFYTVSIPL